MTHDVHGERHPTKGAEQFVPCQIGIVRVRVRALDSDFDLLRSDCGRTDEAVSNDNDDTDIFHPDMSMMEHHPNRCDVFIRVAASMYTHARRLRAFC